MASDHGHDDRGNRVLNPYAAPSARVDRGADVLVGELASRGERLAAATIDGLAYGAVVLFALAGEIGAVIMIGGLIALIVTNVRWLGTYGQSVGKRVVGIHIVRSDGTRATASRLLVVRAALFGLIGIVPVIGSLIQLADILMIFNNDQRCLHDRVADTIVLAGTPPPGVPD